MIIKKVHIDGFGKLVDFDLDLEHGFNLVYGSNEAGKSTLLAFIRAIFYGLNDRKRKDLREDPRSRYLPWNTKANYGGYIVFEHEGSRYRINRRFGSTKSKDETQFLNDLNNVEIMMKPGFEPGDHLFGIHEDEFANTVFIGQMQSVMSSSQNIQSKLVQLTAGTGPSVAPERMVEQLKDIKKNRYTKNSANSRDRILEAKLNAMRSALNEAVADEEARLALRDELQAMNEELTLLLQDIDEVKQALSVETKYRQKDDYVSLLKLNDDLEAVDQALIEQAEAIGQEAWPDSAALESLEQDLLRWERLDERLSMHHAQIQKLDEELAAYPAELELNERIELLRKQQEELADISDEAQVLKDMRSAEEQKFQENKRAKEASRQALIHERESLLTEIKNAETLYLSKREQLVSTIQQIESEKIKHLAEHENELERAQQDKARSLERKQLFASQLSEANQRSEAIRKRAARQRAEVSSLQQKLDETKEQVEAARQSLLHAESAVPQGQKASPLYFYAGIIAAIGIILLLLGITQEQLGLSLSAGAVLLIAIILALIPLFRREGQAAAGLIQERINQAGLDLRRLESLQVEYEGRLYNASAEDESDREELERIALEIVRNQERLGALEVECQGFFHALAVLEAKDEASLLEELLVREKQHSSVLEEFDQIRNETVTSESERLDQKDEALQLSESELAEMQFILSNEYQDRELQYQQVRQLLWQGLNQLGIEDEDALAAMLNRVGVELTQRQRTATQLIQAQESLEQASRDKESLLKSIDLKMGAYIDLTSLETAKRSWRQISDQLRKYKMLNQERKDIEQRLLQGLKGQTIDSVRQALQELSEWFEVNEKLIELYKTYGSEALHDQAADLDARLRERLELRGSKQRALSDLESAIQLPSDIEREIEGLEEEYEELQFQVAAIDRAIRMIEESEKAVRQTFGPQIDQKTNEYLARLTGKQNDQLKVSSDFTVELSDSDSMLYEYLYYSEGKIDQIYLALRLAIGESIYDTEAQLPFFYDDILVQYDKERAAHTLDFLVEHSRESGRQVFFVTCHDYLKSALEEKYEISAISMDSILS